MVRIIAQYLVTGNTRSNLCLKRLLWTLVRTAQCQTRVVASDTLTAFSYTVKRVLSFYSKEEKKRTDNRLMHVTVKWTDNRLMHVKSIAECSRGAFCSTFDLHLDAIWISEL